MRIRALTAAAIVCVALLVAGCGGGGSSAGSNSTTPPASGGGTPKKATAPNAPAGSKVVACGQGVRATAVDCGTARRIERRWDKHRSCALPAGASRGSCALGGFRCQTVKSGDRVAVSCARPGGDIAFVRPGG